MDKFLKNIYFDEVNAGCIMLLTVLNSVCLLAWLIDSFFYLPECRVLGILFGFSAQSLKPKTFFFIHSFIHFKISASARHTWRVQLSDTLVPRKAMLIMLGPFTWFKRYSIDNWFSSVESVVKTKSMLILCSMKNAQFWFVCFVVAMSSVPIASIWTMNLYQTSTGATLDCSSAIEVTTMKDDILPV